jgi:hypothetical protein
MFLVEKMALAGRKCMGLPNRWNIYSRALFEKMDELLGHPKLIRTARQYPTNKAKYNGCIIINSVIAAPVER